MAKAKKQEATETPNEEKTPVKKTAAKKAAPAAAAPAVEAVKVEEAKVEAAPATKPAAKKPEAKKSQPKMPEPKKVEQKTAPKPAALPAFSISTDLAARSAANVVANRDAIGGATLTGGGSGAEKRAESGAFKQLKQNLNQPGAALNKLLGIPSGSQRSNTPLGGSGPTGHRKQTFGADTNRVGVPRRTNG